MERKTHWGIMPLIQKLKITCREFINQSEISYLCEDVQGILCLFAADTLTAGLSDCSWCDWVTYWLRVDISSLYCPLSVNYCVLVGLPERRLEAVKLQHQTHFLMCSYYHVCHLETTLHWLDYWLCVRLWVKWNMLKSRMSSNLNNVQAAVTAVNFYYLLWELNEREHRPLFSQGGHGGVERSEHTLL